MRQDPRRGLRRRAGVFTAVVSCFIGLALVGGAGSATAAPAPAPPAPAAPTVSAMNVISRMQPSWNLGNTLDAIPDETSWGNPLTTKALFDTIKANGFRSVRIPVTWSGHQSATAPYAIDAAWMARVRQVVDLALSDGLYAEINVHHDSWQWIWNMQTDHDNVLARFNATWTQIAAAFKDEPSHVLFESVNEPQFQNATDAQKQADLDELNTSFHTIVRASGGNNATRVLVLPTVGCTPDTTLMNNLATEMASLHDPNLAATVHYYSYWPFSVNVAGTTTFDTTTQNDLLSSFQRMHDIFTSKGIPVYLGEYGTLAYDPTKPPLVVEHGEMLKYYELLGYEARLNNVTTALWDPYSMLDRSTMQWRDPALAALIKASWSTRSATASSDNVFVSKSSPITDHTLTLNLNGTHLTQLVQGGAPLVRGRDYTLVGDQLTLKASALTRLTGSRAYGTNATLEARFVRGAPWQLNVITYDPPTQSDISGTGTSLDIPTQFHGDQLATMKGTYADGTFPGSQSWTAYQEFGTAFVPDYANNVLTLKADFVNTLKDGVPATLTLYFWSGATTTYHVTKTGNSIVGSVS